MADLGACDGVTGAVLAVISVPMDADAAPVNVSGGPSGGAGTPSISDPATVTVTYAVLPVTYAWEQVSGGTITITDPALATTTFSAPSSGVPVSGEFRCLVTDARNLTVYSNNVGVNLTA